MFHFIRPSAMETVFNVTARAHPGEIEDSIYYCLLRENLLLLINKNWKRGFGGGSPRKILKNFNEIPRVFAVEKVTELSCEWSEEPVHQLVDSWNNSKLLALRCNHRMYSNEQKVSIRVVDNWNTGIGVSFYFLFSQNLKPDTLHLCKMLTVFRDSCWLVTFYGSVVWNSYQSILFLLQEASKFGTWWCPFRSYSRRTTVHCGRFRWRWDRRESLGRFFSQPP